MKDLEGDVSLLRINLSEGKDKMVTAREGVRGSSWEREIKEGAKEMKQNAQIKETGDER